MKKIIILAVSLVLLSGVVFAENDSWQDNGRYMFKIMHGRAVGNTRIPAMVLDTVYGIVWTCQNLQDGKPLWVRADLGENGDKVLNKKKYVCKMLEWQDSDLRMPAIVVDIEEGITWTCQNVIDGRARWVETDLKSGAEKEISRTKIGIIKK